jgi:hypothetical protein
VGAKVRPEARATARSYPSRYRVLDLEEFSAALESGGPLRQSRQIASAKTAVGRALLVNEKDIRLTIAALVSLIDDKILSVKGERPNSDDAIADRDARLSELERLRGQVLRLEASTESVQQGSKQGERSSQAVATFSGGTKSWWAKNHERICDTGYGVGLFTTALTICSLAGVHGNVVTVVAGVLAGGKPIADALKGLGKKLFS